MNKNTDPSAFGVSPADFRAWRSPRFGISNPQKIHSPVWTWLVKSNLYAASSTEMMKGSSPADAGPTWCFDRFGQSSTKLADGRVVHVAGEFEDFYDPDFYIYNDVIVELPSGEVAFYCYPRPDFPPTDFHSATLVGNQLILIGSLGYSADRQDGITQVYRLNLDDFQMTKIDCGGDSPGWIHSHEAQLSTDKTSVLVKNGLIDLGSKFSLRENIDDWALNLHDWQWLRLTERKWPRWELMRADNTSNHLYDIRQALWSYGVHWQEEYKKEMSQLKVSMGFKPNLNLIKTLYEFDFDHTEMVEDEGASGVRAIYVDGIKVRFVEEDKCLKVTVEGALGEKRVASIKAQLISKLTKIEKTKWRIEAY